MWAVPLTELLMNTFRSHSERKAIQHLENGGPDSPSCSTPRICRAAPWHADSCRCCNTIAPLLPCPISPGLFWVSETKETNGKKFSLWITYCKLLHEVSRLYQNNKQNKQTNKISFKSVVLEICSDKLQVTILSRELILKYTYFRVSTSVITIYHALCNGLATIFKDHIMVCTKY